MNYFNTLAISIALLFTASAVQAQSETIQWQEACPTQDCPGTYTDPNGVEATTTTSYGAETGARQNQFEATGTTAGQFLVAESSTANHNTAGPGSWRNTGTGYQSISATRPASLPDNALPMEICCNGIDDDNDGTIDNVDECGGDKDMDGVADFCDLDDDNDGILDTDEDGCAIFDFNLAAEINPIDGVTVTEVGEQTDVTFTITEQTPGTSDIQRLRASNRIQFQNDLASYMDTTTLSATYSPARSGLTVRFDDFDQATINSNSGLPGFAEGYTVTFFFEGSPVSYVVESIGGNIEQDGNSFRAVQGGNTTNDPDNVLFLFSEELVDSISVSQFAVFINDNNQDPSRTGSNLEFGTCDADIDNDGIPNFCDLDSDGDGCPDAVEGSLGLTNADLQLSSIDGGNAGADSDPVTANLSGDVDANGVPLSAAGGQDIGDSENDDVQDADCQPFVEDCCNGIDDDLNGIIDDADICGGDKDMDGVLDVCDLDDDNDGILDSVESVCEIFDFDLAGEVNPIDGVTVTEISQQTDVTFTVTEQTPGTSDIQRLRASNRIQFQNDLASYMDTTTLSAAYSPARSGLTVRFDDFDQATVSSSSGLPGFAEGYTIRFFLGGSPVPYIVESIGGNIEQDGNSFRAVQGGNTTNDPDNILFLRANEFVDSISVSQFAVFINDNNQDPSRTGSNIEFGTCDTDDDGDGVLNRCDLDSDGDGCPDALEAGNPAITLTNLQNDTITGGVDTNGVPLLAAGGSTPVETNEGTADFRDENTKTACEQMDFGDYTPFGEADHVHFLETTTTGTPLVDTAVWLGTVIDFEDDQLNSGDATGDNADGLDDEDAIADFPTEVKPGESATFDLTLNSNNPDEVFYGIWIDYNKDGTCDEFIAGSATTTAGPVTVTPTFNVPAGLQRRNARPHQH